MRYIRTKDNIYEVKDDFITVKEQELYWLYFQDHIIGQADTVEELCDAVIYVKAGYENNIEAIKDFQKRNRKLFDKDLIVYGAIWTYDSDGVPTLKSVAKMNGNGEFELL